jgi:tungstate transport system ATP-binding protein
MTATPVLAARGLVVERGGVRVLDVADFSLAPGEFVSLIGPNGSGKSTLLLSLMCLLPRAGGEVRFRGEPVGTDGEAIALRRRMAMVLQEPLLFQATVYENVAAGLRIRGLPRREERPRVEAYLERFGVGGLAGRAARSLSGGEARRVSIARALAVEPEVVFLDEPFANLDPPARQAITDDLERTIHETGAAAILVTHDQAEALRLSARVVVMQRGAIVQSGAPAEVMNEPVNEFVASCMGLETIVEGRVVRSAGGEIVMAVGGREILAIGEGRPGELVYCCLRQEHVTIELASPAGSSSARNVFPARIAGVTSAGAYLKVKLDCGFPLVATVTSESLATLGLVKGRDVFASFKATAVHVIRRA